MSSSDGEQSVLSSASLIMARHRKKKWKRRIFGGISGTFRKSSKSKFKKSRSVSQSVGSLIENATSTVMGNLNTQFGSWGNLDSLSTASNISDDSVESHDSYDRLSVPVQFSDSGILQSSQESLLFDLHSDQGEVGILLIDHTLHVHVEGFIYEIYSLLDASLIFQNIMLNTYGLCLSVCLSSICQA